ncbi:MAG: T9SS type A sorting domain-containing protein [Carboxylicivirga sp.]|jgi:pimeloyl-ACP methyl ester carboxylesterase|nr:T9SS type A sorting domain-containing protein [Carboxylicivirga sp.]
MKTKFLTFILFVFISGIMCAQSIDLDDLPDVQDYIEVRSNPGADTVMIALHGGPTDIPNFGQFDFFATGKPGISLVEMKKHHHLKDANVIYNNSDLTMPDAILHNDTTVAMVQKAVKHFNDQNKEVILIGHSFGAFVLAEYMDDYGTSDLYKIIPMSGRLNMNQEVVNGFRTGYFATFIDGVDVNVFPNQEPAIMWGRMKLMAGVGYNRYVDSLKNVDMKNVMYVYGTHDAAVGRLLDEEIELLEGNGARVERIAGGSHSSPFAEIRLINVLDFIRPPVSTGMDEFEVNEIKMYPTLIANMLTIETQQAGIIMIHDMSGKMLIQKQLNAGVQKVEVSDLPAGIYIATYQTEDNKVTRKKLVKRSN